LYCNPFYLFSFLIFSGLKKQTVTSIQEQIYDLVAIVSEHQLCLGGNRSWRISFHKTMIKFLKILQVYPMMPAIIKSPFKKI